MSVDFLYPDGLLEDGLPAPTPPISIIRVPALFTSEFVVEIEATALLA